MTKLYKYLMMAIAVFAFASCSQEDDAAYNETAIKKNVQFVVGEYPGFADNTRAIGVEDAGKTGWTSGDQLFVKVSGGSVVSNQYITLTFDGTAWTSTADVLYLSTSGQTITAIWAPGYTMDASGVMTAKSGVLPGTTEYMETACAVDMATGTVNVKFDTATDRKYSRLRIVPREGSANVVVTTEGFTPADGGVAQPSYTLVPDAKGNAYLYGKWAASGTVKVAYTISGKGFAKTHTFGSATVGNRSYALNAQPLGEILNPEDTKKGDFAMVDGSFVSKDKVASLTDEQKKGCVGLVFWTESEDGNATLATDKVLALDFPQYNHGLIMALRNLLEDKAWQKPSESVYAEFQNTSNFTDPNKALYPSVESSYEEGQPIHKIVGYSTTKLLKQYNAYCKANGKLDNIVLPVAALDTFSVAAPDNTSGWFIPSVKEMTLLFGDDVDDVYMDEVGYADRQMLEDLMVQAGLGKPLYVEYDYYWTTLERIAGVTWFVYAGDCLVTTAPKSKEYNALPICAY